MVNVRHIIRKERDELREKIRNAKRSRREAQNIEESRENNHIVRKENKDLRETVKFLKNALDDMRTELLVLTEAVESQTAYIKQLLKRDHGRSDDLESNIPLRSEIELMFDEEKTPKVVEVLEFDNVESEALRTSFPLRSEKDLKRLTLKLRRQINNHM